MTDKEMGEKLKAKSFTNEELMEIAFFERVTEHYNWNWLREKLENFDEYGIDDFIFVHFDIKDFRLINELYAHIVADNVLRKICHLMKEASWIIYSCRCDNDNFAMMTKKMPKDEIKAYKYDKASYNQKRSRRC